MITKVFNGRQILVQLRRSKRSIEDLMFTTKMLKWNYFNGRQILPEFLPCKAAGVCLNFAGISSVTRKKVFTTRNGKLPIFYDEKVFNTENVEMELFQRVQKTPTQGFCLDLVWNTRETT